ncbi:MAG: hypothetical protein R6U50_08290 [Desulfobacterales bacterium]
MVSRYGKRFVSRNNADLTAVRSDDPDLFCSDFPVNIYFVYFARPDCTLLNYASPPGLDFIIEQTLSKRRDPMLVKNFVALVKYKTILWNARKKSRKIPPKTISR